MTIADIRKRSGLTQKAFADKYRLPLQTLKQWESSPESSSYRRCPEYLIYYLDRLTEQPSVSVSWEEARHKKYRFPVIYATELFDVSRIHPLKQKVSVAVAKFVQECAAIEESFVFGGATTIRCHSGSDIDVAIKIKPERDSSELRDMISEAVQQLTEWNADVIWLNDEPVNSQLYRNVMEGVRISA